MATRKHKTRGRRDKKSIGKTYYQIPEVKPLDEIIRRKYDLAIVGKRICWRDPERERSFY